MLSPIIMLAYNEAQETWHPLLMEEKPLPGGHETRPRRWKSRMHHTAGFATRDEAETNARDDLAPRVKEYWGVTPELRLNHVLSWDGRGIPAHVAFFDPLPSAATA